MRRAQRVESAGAGAGASLTRVGGASSGELARERRRAPRGRGLRAWLAAVAGRDAGWRRCGACDAASRCVPRLACARAARMPPRSVARTLSTSSHTQRDHERRQREPGDRARARRGCRSATSSTAGSRRAASPETRDQRPARTRANPKPGYGGRTVRLRRSRRSAPAPMIAPMSAGARAIARSSPRGCSRGQVALVTGGGTGLGRATRARARALRRARRRSPGGARSVLERGRGRRSRGVGGDVRLGGRATCARPTTRGGWSATVLERARAARRARQQRRRPVLQPGRADRGEGLARGVAAERRRDAEHVRGGVRAARSGRAGAGTIVNVTLSPAPRDARHGALGRRARDGRGAHARAGTSAGRDAGVDGDRPSRPGTSTRR